MVDDIKPEQPEINKLVKFADDICAPVISNSDSVTEEVRNIDNWASRNRMTLNLSKTWGMLLSGGTSKAPPVSIDGIERKNG